MAAKDPGAPLRGATFMRQWRKMAGLTQEQAAERVELDRTTYSRIENGKLPYNQDFLERLALAFGCEAAEILSVDPLKPDPPKLVYDKLRRAPAAVQQQAIDMLNVLLRDVA
jgi:transcriptional regulator with XRE-family HTH domain